MSEKEVITYEIYFVIIRYINLEIDKYGVQNKNGRNHLSLFKYMYCVFILSDCYEVAF